MSDYNRRQVLRAGTAGAAGLLIGAGVPVGASASTGTAGSRAADGTLLWYDEDAGSARSQSVPVGNGRLGAMVFGGAATERLQLNEDTIWAGGPHDYANPNGLAALPRIRELVFADQWVEAQNLINSSFMGVPSGQAQYQTAGNLCSR